MPVLGFAERMRCVRVSTPIDSLGVRLADRLRLAFADACLALADACLALAEHLSLVA
jgi:hypothetical protein